MKILYEVSRIAEDIRTMRIRGAGRIARAAALGLKIAAEKFEGKDGEEFRRYIKDVAEYLRSTRPTAVSLPNALTFVVHRLMISPSEDLEELRSIVVKSAEEFIEYSKKATENIGKIGAKRIEDGDRVLTHCNSSAALSVIIYAFKEGKDIKVYNTETRPKFQGYITARKLLNIGIKTTLIPDSSVRAFMKKIDKVVVGADTVAANGVVVNKIGTSQIALAAKEANVDFYVAAETYKFSPTTVLGEYIVIEERSPKEIVRNMKIPENINIRNPAFDVTPAEYIDAIITEMGIIPPQAAILILKEHYGWAIRDYLIRELSIDEA
ncbi:MAG: ribose 1,5-bisphosphate isomerase [Thermofilum sp. ex4484_79]|nr:MAG: ribose 1,5-bisphosphate isomerase [Thermofilum sp. ex4484_79]